MIDWLFHWIHDNEVLKLLVPSVGYIFVGILTWLGAWQASKISKQNLEDVRQATPPELLRLEKWSKILKDSVEYPTEIKDKLDMKAIVHTYNVVLARATQENRVVEQVMRLGIEYADVRDALISIKIGSGNGIYPKKSWKNNIGTVMFIIYSIFIFIIFPLFIIKIFSGINILENELFLIMILILTIIMTVAIYMIKTPDEVEKDIIFRNGYRVLKDSYLIPEISDVYEDGSQDRQRNRFEKKLGYSRSYSGWREKTGQKHPNWTSWNYGLLVDWDNIPKRIRLMTRKKIIQSSTTSEYFALRARIFEE